MAELTDPDRAGAPTGAGGDRADDPVLREIARAVRGLRFGSVEITVHDGAVVQIERKEKFRPGRDASRSRG